MRCWGAGAWCVLNLYLLRPPGIPPPPAPPATPRKVPAGDALIRDTGGLRGKKIYCSWWDFWSWLPRLNHSWISHYLLSFNKVTKTFNQLIKQEIHKCHKTLIFETLGWWYFSYSLFLAIDTQLSSARNNSIQVLASNLFIFLNFSVLSTSESPLCWILHKSKLIQVQHFIWILEIAVTFPKF